MNQPPASFDPRRFRTTVPFYGRYRLGYPDSLIERVVGLVGLEAGDAVLDLGCGPGFLAVAFARLGMHVTAVDPEPDMTEACRHGALEAGVSISIRQASSFDLPNDIDPSSL